jgi:hypothetical protein
MNQVLSIFLQVKRALPPDVLSKYEQRQAEDAVARAQLEGLVSFQEVTNGSYTPMS